MITLNSAGLCPSARKIFSYFGLNVPEFRRTESILLISLATSLSALCQAGLSDANKDTTQD